MWKPNSVGWLAASQGFIKVRGNSKYIYFILHVIMSTPLGVGHIIFAFSAVRFPVVSRKSIYPIFTRFGMGVYWVNSLHGIAFGEDSSIAN